ncbi:hypothetical protein BC628DRAFT_1340707 [Trametes gibbosa]|nr:hypothetical protein BC628DRAFT_1340707 [Trametes gibbosa]
MAGPVRRLLLVLAHLCGASPWRHSVLPRAARPDLPIHDYGAPLVTVHPFEPAVQKARLLHYTVNLFFVPPHPRPLPPVRLVNMPPSASEAYRALNMLCRREHLISRRKPA